MLSASLLKNPIHALALGFGTGLVAKAPGTFGTLIGVGLYWLLSTLDLSLPFYIVVTVVCFLAGIWICQYTADALGVHDHPAIVWDEVVGYLITMTFAPNDWLWALMGFALFRLFDIWKPWPIRVIDRSVHGGFGIMFDDVLAGIYAAVVLALIAYILPAL
ncbi:MAG: phosphatidylglycerophosphatase A [Gammaproteobacteria bacterium]|nr:phosphatidylglycerophosphatase A [Gammaproteobacteria bacterium]PCH62120.1 MAG: phosphatidylglycerophosphatase A [Gammaproteobacteria bacterium]PCH62654.1 MAG: phosphatidylglycerophosphatase A [Gammaproteobacteria bacterium]